jgi:hypothetical protein
MKRYLFILFLLTFIAQMQAQQPDNATKRRGGAVPISKDSTLVTKPPIIDSNLVKITAIDTSKIANDSLEIRKPKHPIRNFIRKDYPNPRKAVLFSILPGGGQIYNKSYWKLPFLYGGIVGMTLLYRSNSKQYNSLKAGYFAKVNGLPDTEARFMRIDATSLKTYRDGARKNLELSGVIFALGYLLFTAEAFVDAHLGRFDVNDDLSFKIKPTFMPNNNGEQTAGIGLAFHFN